jgi:hypothetical protein
MAASQSTFLQEIQLQAGLQVDLVFQLVTRPPCPIGGRLVQQPQALLLFLWVGSGALRRVRGRSSQVKGACSVAARGNAAELAVR